MLTYIQINYGVATVRCDKDVAADLRGAIAVPELKHFAAITKSSDVGAQRRAIDGYTGHKGTVMAMRLSARAVATGAAQAGRMDRNRLR